ncbi:transglycosylase family protein [Streptomyces decoyicus]
MGVTGAGIALPLLGASGAHAADTATWDKVAQCESGGVWSAASGNGYYGGLQLTQELWDTYGGAAYASRPDLASRSQQIAVAQSILDARGPDQWSSCAVSAGLAKDGRAPEVDPGSTATPSPAPSDADGSSDPWDSSGSSGAHDDTDSAGQQHDDPDSAGQQHDESGDEPSDPAPSPDATDSDRSGDASTSPEPSDPATPDDSTTPGDRDRDPSQSADPSDGGSRPDTTGTPQETPAKGKHRGGADDDEDRSAGGRHASRGDDAHRTGPAADGDYTVRPGDTLSAIAQAHRLPGGWAALYEGNEGVIGSDADLIKPGQLLDLGHTAG